MQRPARLWIAAIYVFAATAAQLPVHAAAQQSAKIDCYRRAREMPLPEDDALRLCRGNPEATAKGPVECFIRARRNATLTNDELIRLCRCAPSPAPAECLDDARKNTILNTDEIIELCAPYPFDLYTISPGFACDYGRFWRPPSTR